MNAMLCENLETADQWFAFESGSLINSKHPVSLAVLYCSNLLTNSSALPEVAIHLGRFLRCRVARNRMCFDH